MKDPLSSQLWLPHHEREPHFSAPSIEELTSTWANESLEPLVVLPEEIYGVAEIPAAQPTAVVSLDLCEVVRETGVALLRLRGGTLDDMLSDGETGYMDYGSHYNGWDGRDNIDPQAMRQLFVQELMYNENVLPIELHESIAAMLRKWRSRGVYVIANTSTLPGCEVSTIKFMNTHYADCTQGILLPRNHDGNGPVTKARALNETLQAISEQAGYELEKVPIVAIDDALHHAKTYSENGVKTFVPGYDWNTSATNHQGVTRIERDLPGTIDTFIAVDRYLAQYF